MLQTPKTGFLAKGPYVVVYNTVFIPKKFPRGAPNYFVKVGGDTDLAFLMQIFLHV